jgi:hypothetical protein
MENAKQLRNKKGPYYKKWKEGVERFLGSF